MQSTTEWKRTHNCPSPKEIRDLFKAYGRKPTTAELAAVPQRTVAAKVSNPMLTTRTGRFGKKTQVRHIAAEANGSRVAAEVIL